jgi:hypothetical protein
LKAARASRCSLPLRGTLRTACSAPHHPLFAWISEIEKSYVAYKEKGWIGAACAADGGLFARKNWRDFFLVAMPSEKTGVQLHGFSLDGN